jgi:hypothetical protein
MYPEKTVFKFGGLCLVFGMRFDGLLLFEVMGMMPQISGRPVAALQERHSLKEVPLQRDVGLACHMVSAMYH